MTIDRIKNCYSLRKELALIGRRLKTYGEDVHQAQRLKERAAELMSEIDTVEDYIDTLSDSVLRQIVTLRYIEGLGLKETAAYVGYSPNHVSRLIHDLFSEMKLNAQKTKEGERGQCW